jgi:hypothetical protein
MIRFQGDAASMFHIWNANTMDHFKILQLENGSENIGNTMVYPENCSFYAETYGYVQMFFSPKSWCQSFPWPLGPWWKRIDSSSVGGAFRL